MKKLKIAIQKSGRLNEKSVELLEHCGLNFDNYKSSLISPVSNFPLEILFLRDDDIPEYVQDGIADLGIVGENVINETEVEVAYLQRPRHKFLSTAGFFPGRYHKTAIPHRRV